MNSQNSSKIHQNITQMYQKPPKSWNLFINRSDFAIFSVKTPKLIEYRLKNNFFWEKLWTRGTPWGTTWWYPNPVVKEPCALLEILRSMHAFYQFILVTMHFWLKIVTFTMHFLYFFQNFVTCMHFAWNNLLTMHLAYMQPCMAYMQCILCHNHVKKPQKPTKYP